MRYIFLLILLLCAPLMATPIQVIVIRHGEKIHFGSKKGLLDQKGKERAGALVAYFMETKEFGPIGAIFAAHPRIIGDDNTARCVETITPLAEALKLPIHTEFGHGQEALLAQKILSNARFDGKTIVICWHHEVIPNLITAFGYIPPIKHYSGCCYDYAFIMTFPAPEPPVPAEKRHQLLMYQDSNGSCAKGSCP